MVVHLTEATSNTERSKSGVSKWQQTPSDGVIEPKADVGHALRSRLRQVTRLADEAIDNSDPAETWDEFQAWLYRRGGAGRGPTHALPPPPAPGPAARGGGGLRGGGDAGAGGPDVGHPPAGPRPPGAH